MRNLQGYRWADFKKDARAGLNVSLLDFPQGMAYALIAGLPVQYGIYSSAIGSITGPLFASSRFLMLGPTNASAVLLLSGFLALGMPLEQKLSALPLLLLMIAGMLLLAAALRLEVVIQYVSRAVVTGYIAAAACLIVVKQLEHVLAVEVPRSGTFAGTLSGLASELGKTDLAALFFSLATVVIYYTVRRVARFLPAVAVVLVVMALAYAALVHFAGMGLAMLPGLPPGQWPLTMPAFSLSLFEQLMGTAFAVAFLSLLESASIAKNLAARAGDTVNIRQQMVSMGIANTCNAFGSGMPVSGSLTRSQLNFNSGARTPMASIVSGTILVGFVFALGPLIGFIPKAALSALVITVGIDLLRKSEVHTIVSVSREDALTFGVTFLSGLLLPLDKAIYIGVGLSIALFLRKVAQPRLVEIGFNESGELAPRERPREADRPAVSIVHVEGDLFFGSTDVFLDQARSLVRHPNTHAVIVRLLNAHHIDASAALAIRELADFAKREERHVLISGIRADIAPVLRRAGIPKAVGEDNLFYYTPENVTLSTRNALKRAQALLGVQSPEIVLYARPKDKQADAETQG